MKKTICFILLAITMFAFLISMAACAKEIKLEGEYVLAEELKTNSGEASGFDVEYRYVFTEETVKYYINGIPQFIHNGEYSIKNDKIKMPYGEVAGEVVVLTYSFELGDDYICIDGKRYEKEN